MQQMRQKGGLDPPRDERNAVGPRSQITREPTFSQPPFSANLLLSLNQETRPFEFPAHVSRRPRRTKIGSEARSKAI